ncbi:MAG TPA: single-stranded DNA-binding protein [Euzebya sp.]|nr:single-stranded DNA-binding protein [Euzebya sp.]
MSAPNTIIVAGNLTANPELRQTSSEIPFVRMRLAVSRRVFIADTNTWEDRQDGFFAVTAWRDMARHAQASFKKGDRVVICGRLTRRQFEVASEDGKGTENRHVTEIEAEEIGASVRWSPWAKMQTRPLNDAEPVGPAQLEEQDEDEEEGHTVDASAERDVTAAA